MQIDTIIGIDVGGTKTAIVEGTLKGAILHRAERQTEGARAFKDTFPSLAAEIEAAISLAWASARRPIAISVATAGPLRAAEGRLLDPPNLPGWHNIDLKGALSQRFPTLPVFVEHDAKAGALAEFRFGVGAARPGLTDMVFLTFGTGMGAGIIANGRLVRGASEMAGETEMLHPAPDAATRVPDITGWEFAASGRGIRELARRMYPGRWKVDVTTREIVEAALANDAAAVELIAEVARWLGVGIAVIVTVLNPQVIVLGSLATALGDRVMGPARAVLARHALPRAVAACEVVPSALGPRLGDVQSLMAAIAALDL